MLNKIKASLNELCPNWALDKVVVAFSGGLDSTALLNLLVEIKGSSTVLAAHLNHCLRGANSDKDQAFAQTMAQQLKVAFISENCDVKALAVERGRGIEEAARTARYEFLIRAAKTFGAKFVLTAHHSDDSAETMLLNLIKGAGAKGLAGVPPRRHIAGVEIIRPLLSFSRQNLKEWLLANNIPWVEDDSNLNLCYQRNKLRHQIMPLLKEMNPNLVQALIRTGEILQGEEDFWHHHLAGLWAKAIICESKLTISLKQEFVQTLSLAEQRRLIY
ncbi:MAG: tRNA lysidine(34) synthetase TilS, partial [Candidatus Adiutrix sp.]